MMNFKSLPRTTIIALAAVLIAASLSAIGWCSGRDTSAQLAFSTRGARAYEVARRLSPGWNVGSQFDACRNGMSSETLWRNYPVGKAFFDSLAADDIKSVRIPVTWIGHIGPAPEYKVDPALLKRLREVIGYAEQAGLNVILNTHNDCNLVVEGHWLDLAAASSNDSANRQIKQQLGAVWRQIATAFKDKGDFLIFEPFNEAHDGQWGKTAKEYPQQFEIINEWNQIFVDAVRHAGGKNKNRYLIVNGYGTNIDKTLSYFTLPADKAKDRLIVSVHFYSPLDFCLEATQQQWGHTRHTTGKPEKQYDEKYIVNQFDRLNERFINQGIPVVIGEMGCVYRGDPVGEAFRRYYLEYAVKAATDRGMACFIWDNARTDPGKECHAYYHHNTGRKMFDADKMVRAIVRAATDTSSNYTLKSIYDSAPSSPIIHD